MSNTLKVYVEDPDSILDASNLGPGAIARVQSCATKTGVFADLTTIALVAGTRAYTYYDTVGISTTWYRVRYQNAGGTIPASATEGWSDPYQVGVSAGLCELADVRQRLNIGVTDTTSDEELAEFIDVATSEIMGYTGRQFIPDPPSGTVTYVFDVEVSGRLLLIPKGIRSVTTLSYATDDQPDTGGTYTALAATYYHLRPLEHQRDYGWPATRIELGSGYQFYAGYATVQIVGAFGWAAVPADIANIAVNAVVRMFAAKRSASQTADLLVGTAESGYRVLAFLSPAERQKLDWYRDMAVV